MAFRRVAFFAGGAEGGHGDLLADDVFCRSDDLRASDCLEFDDRMNAEFAADPPGPPRCSPPCT